MEEENKEKSNIEELKKELEDCQKTRDEYLSGWQRAKADFINYKREEAERIGGFLKFAEEEILLKIIPILDSFDVAEKSIPKALCDNEHLKGLLQIKSQIMDFLNKQGVEEIEAVGNKFDPVFHEAVEMINEKGQESGIVFKEVKKGYILNGKVIRPAKVIVTK